MSDILMYLPKMPGFISTGSATAEEIHQAEIALSLKFAEDYREYVKKFGCATFVGHEITGIHKSPRLNVIDATMRNRDVFAGIPMDWYVIEETNFDNIVIWQDAQGFLYKAQPGRKPVQIAQRLSDYLNGELS